MASGNIRGYKKNVEIVSVTNFTEETMKTLKYFGKQLKIRLDSNLTQYEKLLI